MDWKSLLLPGALLAFILVVILAFDDAEGSYQLYEPVGYIHEVSRLAADGDLVLYLPESFSERNHWRRFFRVGNRERGFSPADPDYRPENLGAYRGAVVKARLDNRRVWFVGETDTYPELAKAHRIAPNKAVMEFFAYLRETSRFVRPQGTEEPIYELLPKQ